MTLRVNRRSPTAKCARVTEASTWGLSVRVRLFAIHKMPLYQVAVGSMKVTPELRARFAPALKAANPEKPLANGEY